MVLLTHYTTLSPGILDSDWLVQPELIRKFKVFYALTKCKIALFFV